VLRLVDAKEVVGGPWWKPVPYRYVEHVGEVVDALQGHPHTLVDDVPGQRTHRLADRLRARLKEAMPADHFIDASHGAGIDEVIAQLVHQPPQQCARELELSGVKRSFQAG